LALMHWPREERKVPKRAWTAVMVVVEELNQRITNPR